MNCPHCESENTQKFSVVFSNGFSNIETKTKGSVIGFGSGGIAIGGGASKTKGTQQTALSQQCNPPVLCPWIKHTVFAVILILLSGGLFFITLPFGIYYVYKAVTGYRYNKNVYPDAYAVWDRSFLCHRCGGSFEFQSQAA